MISSNSGLPTQSAVEGGRGLSTASATQRLGRKAATCACSHPEQVHRKNGGCAAVGCRCTLLTAPKRQKYNAVRCVGPLGELYDSKAERDYAYVLESRARDDRGRIIRNWSWAPRFVLQDEPLITYRPDFIFWTLDGRPRVVDIKGHAARDFSLRVRLWKARYPNVPLAVVKNGEEIWP